MVFVMSTVYTDQATPLSPPSLPCLIDFENWSIVDVGGVGGWERKTVVCITVLLLVLQGACKVEQVKVNLSGMVMSWWQPGEQATVHGVPLHSVSQIQAQWTP